MSHELLGRPEVTARGLVDRRAVEVTKLVQRLRNPQLVQEGVRAPLHLVGRDVPEPVTGAAGALREAPTVNLSELDRDGPQRLADRHDGRVAALRFSDEEDRRHLGDVEVSAPELSDLARAQPRVGREVEPLADRVGCLGQRTPRRVVGHRARQAPLALGASEP